MFINSLLAFSDLVENFDILIITSSFAVQSLDVRMKISARNRLCSVAVENGLCMVYFPATLVILYGTVLPNVERD